MYHTSAKEFFISVLGLDNKYSHTLLITHDITLQRKNEREPFGELVTTPSGKVVLRIGAVDGNGVKLIV